MRRVVAGLFALAAVAGARSAAAECQGRPTDADGFNGYSYGAAEVKSFAGDKVRVYYATSGPHAPVLDTTRPDSVPDTVAYAAEMGDKALGQYATMGYKPVPSDAFCTSHGDDGKVDIYLVHFTAADGSTFAECEGANCSSFALVEATFKSKGYADAQEGFRTVVTHELFHAVQNTYRTGDAPFWAEGTAQWAMHTVHPELADFARQMTAFFAEPSRSIDSPPGGVTAGFLYGSAIWPLFLSIHHDEAFIRSVFEAEAASPSATPLATIETLLQAQSTSLAEEYPVFAAWNVGTGKQKSVGGYPDAAKYPGVKTAPLVDGVHEITSGLGFFAYHGTLDDTRALSLETDEARNAAVVVPIDAQGMRLDQLQRLPTTATGEVMVIVSGVTTKKTDAPFTLHIGNAPAEPGGAVDAGVKVPTPAPNTTTTSDDGGCQSSRRTNGGTGFGAVLPAALGLVLAALRRRRT